MFSFEFAFSPCVYVGFLQWSLRTYNFLKRYKSSDLKTPISYRHVSMCLNGCLLIVFIFGPEEVKVVKKIQ